MAGISKIVDDRIEQLRREKMELDAMRTRLEEREAQLIGRETRLTEQEAAALAMPISIAGDESDAPAKRKRGRPRKGESPNQPPEGSDLWRKAQADMAKMRAAQFIELAEIEKQKSELLDAMLAEKAEFMDMLAKMKIDKMKELEEYLEAYREECFENIQNDLQRQKELNRQRLAEAQIDEPASPVKKAAPKKPAAKSPTKVSAKPVAKAPAKRKAKA
ncbi:MAG: hypothetical protein FWC16_12245 [Defluviitaleaceae bacterium]|nr:hypothetical protein [Defluviitaleaceae bacterium]MCL2275690.1 hypothetical protein [Defluviitaleaceae bacterium]